MKELLNPYKRLIWNTNVITFNSWNDILRHDSSNFVITNSGLLYLNRLLGNLNYVQEMILDTRVEIDIETDEYDALKIKENSTMYNRNIQNQGYFQNQYDLTDTFDRIRLIYNCLKYFQ